MKLRPLLVGRGPWGQTIARTLEELKVDYTLCGSMTADDALSHAKVRGNTHVIIATPLSTHARLVLTTWMQSRLNDEPLLPVFVEKPACSSVEELNQLYTFWLTQGQPKFLCNSVHLFAEGCEEMRKTRLWPTCTMAAYFGGPGPNREDCNHVWDYGWHPLSLAFAAGVPIEALGFKLSDDKMVIYSPDESHRFMVSNAFVNKVRNAEFTFGTSVKFMLHPECWSAEVKDKAHPQHVWKFEKRPPLKRALQLFLSAEHDWKNDYRFGFELPLAVTRVLESLCPSHSSSGSTSVAQK